MALVSVWDGGAYNKGKEREYRAGTFHQVVRVGI
jgi:hypothetical protein